MKVGDLLSPKQDKYFITHGSFIMVGDYTSFITPPGVKIYGHENGNNRLAVYLGDNKVFFQETIYEIYDLNSSFEIKIVMESKE